MFVNDFDAFYEEHQQRLIRLCWLLSVDRDDAVEIAQEALTRAWQNWESISSVGSDPVAWTNRVAVNLSSNYRRQHATRRRWKHLFASPEPSQPKAENDDLARALRRLSVRQRQAIVLRYWHDLDLQGCAEAMDVSVGSVKTHLSRAHSTLRLAGELSLEEEQ